MEVKVHLDPGVTAEVKVELVGMCDVCVHGGASRNVSTSANLSEEAERSPQCLFTLQKCKRPLKDSETRLDSFTHPLIAIRAEQTRVMALLHDNVSDAWLIVLLQTDAGLPDGQELIVQHLWKKKAFIKKNLETK